MPPSTRSHRKDKRIQLRVDEDLHREVLRVAKSQNKTVSGLVEDYLRSLVQNYERRDELGIEQA